jgi:hypothetical protein
VLTFVDGGAVLAYPSVGARWGDLVGRPRLEARVEPPWQRGLGGLSWYWWPVQGGSTFASGRVAYFPLYMLLPPLGLAAWLLRRGRRGGGTCRGCGYDLTGNVSGRCPECGTACLP